MANIVIVFESRYGQTHEIAEHIADGAQRQGHTAKLVRVSAAMPPRLDEADAVVVVAPVYFGRHPRVMRTFMRTHGQALDKLPFVFVSVSNSAAQTGTEAFAQAERIAHRVLEAFSLHPLAVVCVAGAIAYPRYGFFVRHMMRLIAKSTHGPVDMTRVHVLTDWPRLDRDLAPFFSMLAKREGATVENGARHGGVALSQ